MQSNLCMYMFVYRFLDDLPQVLCERASARRVMRVFLNRLLEQFFRLVDLGRKVRASTAIGVVESHEIAVVCAELVLSHGAFTGKV